MSLEKYPSFLQRVYIAAPCSMSWNSMPGDDKARSCAKCSRQVYNLSAMTTVEAEAFLKKQDGTLCLTFYRRKDGTIMTENCPVGLRRIRDRWRRLVQIVATTLAFVTAPGVLAENNGERTSKGQVYNKLRKKNVPQLTPHASPDLATIVGACLPPAPPSQQVASAGLLSPLYENNQHGIIERANNAGHDTWGPNRYKLSASIDLDFADSQAFDHYILARENESQANELVAETYYKMAFQALSASHDPKMRVEIAQDYAAMLRRQDRDDEADTVISDHGVPADSGTHGIKIWNTAAK